MKLIDVLTSEYLNKCSGIVTKDGEQDACGKPTTCIIDDPDGGPWPACTWHGLRYGADTMVPLVQVVAEVRREAGNAFCAWAAKNEIDPPPLDWAWFGEIVRWAGAGEYADDEVSA